jgi:hypothetical protein
MMVIAVIMIIGIVVFRHRAAQQTQSNLPS